MTPDRSENKAMVLSSLGGILEYYDFIIFIFMTPYLEKIFFADSSTYIATLKTLAIFSVGYLVRPLGGMVFSHFGDRYGRKVVFMLTILFMAIPSLAIGCLPTPAQIGEWSAVLLLGLRLLQGLALGGEIPAAITFISEYVDSSRRGWALAVLFFGINLGLMLGSLVASQLSAQLSEGSIIAWGWRLPFILGGVFGVISLWLRRYLHETQAFMALKPEEKARIPLVTLMQGYGVEILIGFFLVGIGAVTVFMFLYWPTYLSQYLGYDFPMVLRLNTVATLMLSVTILLGGWLGDRIGYLRVYLACAIVLILFTYPLFYIFTWKQTGWLIGVYLLFSFVFGFIPSAYTSLLSLLFPTPVRYSGVALSYNSAYALIGGLSPVLCTLLIEQTGHVLAPAFYVMAISLLSFIAGMMLLRRRLGDFQVRRVTAALDAVADP